MQYELRIIIRIKLTEVLHMGDQVEHLFGQKNGCVN